MHTMKMVYKRYNSEKSRRRAELEDCNSNGLAYYVDSARKTKQRDKTLYQKRIQEIYYKIRSE